MSSDENFKQQTTQNLSDDSSAAEEKIDVSNDSVGIKENPEADSEIPIISSESEHIDKKPIYKNGWFWPVVVVVIVLILGICAALGGNEEKKPNTEPTPVSKTESADTKETDTTKEDKSSTSTNKSEKKEEPVYATEAEKEELRAAIDEANAIDLELYTSDTAAAVTLAIQDAEAVYADEKALPSKVDKAIEGINETVSKLEEKIQPVVLSGNGDDVVDIPSELAICLVTAEYSSDSNFIIKTLDSNGGSIDLLVNTIGAYYGTTTTGMRNGTPAYLEVSASGPWTITLKPIADADVLENGQMMHGDNVVLASSSAAKKLTINNSGKGNFIVYGISSSSSKLLVNEIGDYSGTVVNNGSSLFIVESEGDWSISWE